MLHERGGGVGFLAAAGAHGQRDVVRLLKQGLDEDHVQVGHHLAVDDQNLIAKNQAWKHMR